MHTREMIASHPDVRGNVNQSLLAAIDEAYACAQACTSCADACLAEEMVAQLRQCIRLNLDCADVCAATATVGSRRTGSDEEVIRKMLDACAAACRPVRRGVSASRVKARALPHLRRRVSEVRECVPRGTSNDVTGLWHGCADLQTRECSLDGRRCSGGAFGSCRCMGATPSKRAAPSGAPSPE